MQQPVKTYCRSIRSSSAELIACRSYVNFGSRSASSWPTKAPTRSVLVECGSGYKNCRKPTPRPKNWGQKMATKILMECYTIMAYLSCPRPFRLSSSARITTTRWPAIWASKRHASCWLGSTTGQSVGTTLRPMSRAVMYVWYWKQWSISLMVTCNLCHYPLIRAIIYWWTLWPAYPS